MTQRVNVVWREEVDYVRDAEPDGPVPPDRAGDGWLDHVHALRDVYGADIVHLIYERDPPTKAGTAWHIVKFGPDSDRAAFSISNRRVDSLFFAHELGHNMGLGHDRYREKLAGNLDPGDSSYNKPYPHSYGYVNQRAFEPDAAPTHRWFTIMAYVRQCTDLLSAGCEHILRFSNADQTFRGAPLGMPGDTPSSAVDGPADSRRDSGTDADEGRQLPAQREPKPLRVPDEPGPGTRNGGWGDVRDPRDRAARMRLDRPRATTPFSR